MKENQIKREDIIDLERYNRDAEIIKLNIRLLCFLNTITFKIFEDRLIFQCDKMIATWSKAMEDGEYFTKTK